MPNDKALKDPLGSIPRYAIYRNRKMRVLEYLGEGKFLLLDKDDSKLQVHRDRITLVKS